MRTDVELTGQETDIELAAKCIVAIFVLGITWTSWAFIFCAIKLMLQYRRENEDDK